MGVSALPLYRSENRPARNIGLMAIPSGASVGSTEADRHILLAAMTTIHGGARIPESLLRGV